jgi:hypothetical protein
MRLAGGQSALVAVEEIAQVRRKVVGTPAYLRHSVERTDHDYVCVGHRPNRGLANKSRVETIGVGQHGIVQQKLARNVS